MVVIVKKSGFPDIHIDFKSLRKSINSIDFRGDYVKFIEGLPKFTEDEFDDNKKILLNFLDELEKDSTKREKLYDSLELTKAGKIKQNAWYHIVNVDGFIPIASCDEFSSFSYNFLGISENWDKSHLKLEIGYKTCAASKLPWKKIETSKKIKSKDTLPMHYYKDSYGKEFLYLGAFELWKKGWNTHTGSIDTSYTKDTYSDVYYIYISKAKLKKYEKVSDLSTTFKDLYTKCNILTKPKTFIEDIGEEKRPLANEIETLDRGGWEIKLVKI